MAGPIRGCVVLLGVRSLTRELPTVVFAANYPPDTHSLSVQNIMGVSKIFYVSKIVAHSLAEAVRVFD